MMNLSFYVDNDHRFSKSFGSVSVPVSATESILPGCLVRRSAKGGDLEVENGRWRAGLAKTPFFLSKVKHTPVCTFQP